ncbi:MAG TPA: amidohydrolase family protein [Sphingomonas sp.]|nr:amidohydrolase family protein [Sphingomonas sp.]
MYDGYFIFDNVIHMFDNRPGNKLGEEGRKIIDSIWGAAKLFSNSQYPAHPSFGDSYIEPAEAYRILFEESDTDMAVAQTVPLMGWFKEGFSPARANHALAAAYPDRVVFCGGVDPLYLGSRAVLDEMQRQREEWNAVSFKFYQSQLNGTMWRADDRYIAYPLWEKCLELGVTSVQFHKGLPFGRQLLEHQRPNDIEQAALDFPELTFIIHHLGIPFIDDTINIASRHPNVWLALSAWINIYAIQPRLALDIIGKALMYVGEDRLLYGSEAFVWPSLQPYIKAFADMQMPEDLQEGYGYPELTREMKRKVFGENQARLFGIDLAKKRQELAGKARKQPELQPAK